MKWLDRALAIAAWALLASILAAALHDVSMAWDVWYYHLPFAARIAGIVPAAEYAFEPLNEARFDGFPLLAELLQGLLWRITGRPESANLVAFSAIPLFAWLMKKRFDVPMHATLLALLAVPLVMIHASSCYVDLPANAAVAGVVMITIRAYGTDEKPDRKTLVLACVLGAVAANMKVLLHPIVLVALVALAVRAREWRVVLVMPVVFFTPLKNLVLHHNPYYPVAMELFGRTLPGPDEPYASSPVWLEHAPRPVRFVCSILEIRATSRWTLDQWTPLDATGYRMGGFFGVYVFANLAFFAWRAIVDRKERQQRAATIGFLALTAIVSVLPQSHELRYYMGWMMTLVALNLWLAKTKRVWVELGAAAAVVAVLVITRATYAYPSGKSFDALVREEVSADALGKVRDGDRVCVQHAPWNFLWAARFHAPKRYVVREADVPADCEGATPL
jgi:hypothetical protein